MPEGIGSMVGSLESGLGTAATDINKVMGPLGKIIQGVSPLFGAYGDYQAQQQRQSLVDRMSQGPPFQPWSPQEIEGIKQQVQGSLGPSVGSGMPQAEAMGMAQGLSAEELAKQQMLLNYLQGASGALPQAGSFAQLLAQITGGLTGSPSATTGMGSTTPLPFASTTGSTPLGVWGPGDPGTGPISGTF